jgi:tetratricopeptide (TPR) repeat protein
MTRPRLAHALVASTAAAALAVGGVLLGAAPVSASSPVSALDHQTEECLDALDAFEAEFGDIDFDDLDGLDGALDDLLNEFFEQNADLFDEADALYERALELGADEDAESVADALEWPKQAAGTALTAAQGEVDARVTDLDEAQTAYDEGLAADPPLGDEELEALLLARDAAQQALTAAEAVRDDAQALVDEIDALITRGTEIEAELDRIFVEEFEPRLEELLGSIEELDLERFLELVTIILTECDLEDDGADDDDTAGGGTAPVATPVKGRASFTG